MIILDAYAALALLRDEPAAQQVQDLIESGEETALTLLGVAEVLDRLVRRAGIDEAQARLDLAQLALPAPPALDRQLAARAGLLRARHYHRRTRALSLADCVAAETARRLGASLATADPALLETCEAEGIAVIALPGSGAGSAPSR
ncbi:MAG: type II toxin-antitoxin system VapC family toxin [Chloroflexi bacterium]|nr:type II toxin-antitoxin system VapC family toxin [Chloroflexota bacterium]